MKGNMIVFNAPNYHLYGIDKTNYKMLYDIEVNTMSNKPAYFYQDTFFYGTYKNQESKVVQFDLHSGNVIKELPFESIDTQPHLIGNTLYFTGLQSGGRLFAYDIEKTKRFGTNLSVTVPNTNPIIKKIKLWWVSIKPGGLI